MKLVLARKVSTDSLPVSIIQQLNGTDFKILRTLMGLFEHTRKKNKSGALWCNPGEKWLGRQVGRSIWTVSRSVQKLARMGLVGIQHRKSKDGTFLTNLYKVGHRVLRLICGQPAKKAAVHLAKLASTYGYETIAFLERGANESPPVDKPFGQLRGAGL